MLYSKHLYVLTNNYLQTLALDTNTSYAILQITSSSINDLWKIAILIEIII